MMATPPDPNRPLSTRDELIEALNEAIEIIVWMSGSPSFGQGGEAHRAWRDDVRPKFDRIFNVAIHSRPPIEL